MEDLEALAVVPVMELAQVELAVVPVMELDQALGWLEILLNHLLLFD